MAGVAVIRQRLALEQLHGHVGHVVLFTHVEYGDDVGVRQPAGGLRGRMMGPARAEGNMNYPWLEAKVNDNRY